MRNIHNYITVIVSVFHTILAMLSAIAYGTAPLIYRRALFCTSQFKAMLIFSLYSIALGLLLPWGEVSIDGVFHIIIAALSGGILGSWLYITAVKKGGPSIGNISSSFYIVMLPLIAGKFLLIPAALLLLLGIAIASWSESSSRRGALYGIFAAFVWTWSINFYAHAVASLGPGGALFIRGLVVSLVALVLSIKAPICYIRRLAIGGFLDSFIGFGAYTLAVSVGDYVSVTLVMSSYPLITTLLERPVLVRRVFGVLTAVVGLYLAVIFG